MRRYLPVLIVASLIAAASAGWAAAVLPGRPISNVIGSSFEARRVDPDPPALPGEIVVPPQDPEGPQEPSGGAPESPPLKDMGGHWAEEFVRGLRALGIIDGYPDGTFRPDRSLTRAESTKMIVLALGLTASPYVGGFSDPMPQWAREYVGPAIASGIVVGYPDGTFRPDGFITRAEMVTMVVRAWPQEDPQSGAAFGDSLPAWALAAIRKAAGAGLVVGYPDGSFRPDRFVTRGEAAAIIFRAYHHK